MDLKKSAVIVIDIQNDFLHPEGLIHRLGLWNLSAAEREALLRNARLLIERMRTTGRAVIWVKTVLRRDQRDSAFSSLTRKAMGLTAEKESLVEGSWGAEIIDGVRPEPDDFFVVKKGASAFQFTHLDRLLSNLGVNTCVTVGGGILDCLADTVRQGGALGYEMIVPSDATGYPQESPYLKNLRNRSVSANTSDILAALSPLEEALPLPSKPALLLIDLQNEFVHPNGFHERLGYSHLSDEERRLIIQNNQRLLKAMRERGYPVIYVVTTYRKDRLDDASSPTALRNRPMPPGEDYLLPGTWGAQVIVSLEVNERDFVVLKKGRSCFGSTPLHRILRNLGVRRCIVTGGGIYGCVEDSVREGAGLGYGFTVVSDATYEPNSPVLKILAQRADCKSTDEVLADLASDP